MTTISLINQLARLSYDAKAWDLTSQEIKDRVHTLAIRALSTTEGDARTVHSHFSHLTDVLKKAHECEDRDPLISHAIQESINISNYIARKHGLIPALPALPLWNICDQLTFSDETNIIYAGQIILQHIPKENASKQEIAYFDQLWKFYLAKINEAKKWDLESIFHHLHENLKYHLEAKAEDLQNKKSTFAAFIYVLRHLMHLACMKRKYTTKAGPLQYTPSILMQKACEIISKLDRTDFPLSANDLWEILDMFYLGYNNTITDIATSIMLFDQGNSATINKNNYFNLLWGNFANKLSENDIPLIKMEEGLRNRLIPWLKHYNLIDLWRHEALQIIKENQVNENENSSLTKENNNELIHLEQSLLTPKVDRTYSIDSKHLTSLTTKEIEKLAPKIRRLIVDDQELSAEKFKALLENCSNLRYLKIKTQSEFLPQLPQSLIELNCEGSKKLKLIGAMPNLQKINSSFCPSLETIEAMPNLQELNCNYCSSLETIGEMHSLENLYCRYCSSLKTVGKMQALKVIASQKSTVFIVHSNMQALLQSLEIIFCPDYPNKHDYHIPKADRDSEDPDSHIGQCHICRNTER